MSFEDFEREYRERRRVYSGQSYRTPQRPLNDKQLRTAHKRHLRKLEAAPKRKRAGERGESPDQAVRKKCLERDGGRCQAIAAFSGLEYFRFTELSGGLGDKLDAAHVFGKKAHPHMRFLPENVVMLNRASHNWLDTGRSPVDGRKITAEEKAAWWRRIVGAERYEALESMKGRKP